MKAVTGKSALLIIWAICLCNLFHPAAAISYDCTGFTEMNYGIYRIPTNANPLIHFVLTNESLITEDAWIYANITLPNGTALQFIAGDVLSAGVLNTTIEFGDAAAWENETFDINLTAYFDPSRVFFEETLLVDLVIYTGVIGEGDIYHVSCLITNTENKIIITIVLILIAIGVIGILITVNRKHKKHTNLSIDCTLEQNKALPECRQKII